MVEDFKNFTQYKRETAPVNIWMVGETYCDEGFRIERSESDLMALEFIISGEGTLEIDGQTLHPLENDVFFCARGADIGITRIVKTHGINIGWCSMAP